MTTPSAPLRVMQLITELRPGGAERVVYELARRLPRERYAVEVCALRPASGAVAEWLRAAEIPVHSLEMKAKLDLRAPGRLVRLLRERRTALLHTHLFHANVLGRAAARRLGGVRVLGTLHIVERRFRPWHFWLDRWTLGRDEVEVCVSAAVRDFTHRRAGIPLAQLRVIPNGVDEERFRDCSAARRRGEAAAALRAELGLAPGAVLALAVGRLEPQKGYADLVDTWARLRAETNAVLLIAGEGTERRALEARLRRAGLAERVRLLGHREDVPELMGAAEVFVSASRYEGFGLAAAEAMAAGLPVVATGVDSVPEVVGTGGAGILVPLRDPMALAAAIAAVLAKNSAERARMGEAGRARIKDRFGIERMVEGYRKVYAELFAAWPGATPAPSPWAPPPRRCR